jgi:type IV pilus assembly protein PilY1
MATYTSYPIFQLNTVAPNILIILDNSASMNEQAHTGAYDHNRQYYGYFEPYKKYTYGSNIFVRDPGGGAWDGNFLNWLTMRKIDVARKVLMGGLATSRTGTGNQTNIGETPAPAGYDFIKSYDDTDNVTPFSSGTNYSYLVDGGNYYVNAGT